MSSIAASSSAMAASPIACTATWKLSIAARLIRFLRTVSLTSGRPALAGRVAIILLEPGAARAEGAVEIELHADHAQAAVIEPGRRPLAGDGDAGCRCPRRRRGSGPAVARDRRRGGSSLQSSALVPMSATVVRPFDSNISCARAKALSRCTGSGAGTVRSTSAIAASTKTPLGAIGRAAAALDAAALGRPGRGGDSGLAHRDAVRPAGMAVDPLQPDRAVADDRRRDRPRSGSGRGPSVPGSSRGRRSSAGSDWRRHIGAIRAERLLESCWCRRDRAGAR